MFVTKLLIKKELQQIFKSYFYNTKKNKARSKASIILCFIGELDFRHILNFSKCVMSSSFKEISKI